MKIGDLGVILDFYTNRFSSRNKHCEILVSCSDKERNSIQALEIACKLIELPESLGN